MIELTGKLGQAQHVIAKLIVVAMIAVTSITGYHFWWHHKLHRMLVNPSQFSRLSVEVKSDHHQEMIDWANVFINLIEKGSPLGLGIATLWLERKRRDMPPAKPNSGVTE